MLQRIEPLYSYKKLTYQFIAFICQCPFIRSPTSFSVANALQIYSVELFKEIRRETFWAVDIFVHYFFTNCIFDIALFCHFSCVCCLFIPVCFVSVFLFQTVKIMFKKRTGMCYGVVTLYVGMPIYRSCFLFLLVYIPIRVLGPGCPQPIRSRCFSGSS